MSARSFDIDKLNTKQSNIRVVMSGASKVVMLHNNAIFAIDNNGFTLSSCSWRTPTTKTAINRAFSQLHMNYRVYQVKGQWFLNKIPFTDGMSITF